MKKILSVLAIGLTLSLVGCGAATTTTPPTAAATTVTTPDPTPAPVVTLTPAEQAVIDTKVASDEKARKEKQAADQVIADKAAYDKAHPKIMNKTNFDTIKNGMTYAQVSAIVGPGTMDVEMGNPGDPMYTVSYSYKGSQTVGGLGANASTMYQGGKLNMKAQLGLTN